MQIAPQMSPSSARLTQPNCDNFMHGQPTSEGCDRRLLKLVRMHGHPCRALPDGSLRAAYKLGPQWVVETLTAPTRSSVMTWLGY